MAVICFLLFHVKKKNLKDTKLIFIQDSLEVKSIEEKLHDSKKSWVEPKIDT